MAQTTTRTSLLGPPQIPIITPIPTTITHHNDNNNKLSSSSSPPFSYPSYPYMGYTENRSATFLASGNPSLDFFFHVVPYTPASELIRLVQLSWTHDPLLTLKLICNLRAVRGTGKSDKQGFYTAALWLHENHPRTLSLNMGVVSGFGYLKDMPEILFRLLEGSDTRKPKEEVYDMIHHYGFMHGRMHRSMHGSMHGRRINKCKKRVIGKEDDGEEKKSEEEKEKARVLRYHRKNERTKKIIERYNEDVNFRLLYDSISDIFADLLKKDMECLQKNDLYNLGFAAKWCPTIDSTYDEVTLLCESIARRVFPKEDYDEYKNMEEAHYAFKVRDRLRKEVLVPLRKALELPEVYICAKKWDALPYNRVPSVAMKLYTSLFYKHDEERFVDYLEKVKSGKATIAAGALLPHEIIASLNNDENGGEVAELQWKRMVDDLAKKGKLNNCMAICDVSGSMSGTPMEVCVALGLLISELSEEPWKGKVITFSENPNFHTIRGGTLKQKTNFIKNMDWGGCTNLQKAFDQILAVAVKAKIPEEQMIKRLFIFSDMEFDMASGRNNPWETDYMVIQRKFKESGYEKVPEIVFWNLRHSKATPVPSTQQGVALVSGFSKNLVTLFLEEGGILNPEDVMLAAVAKPEYDQLVLYD